MSDDLSGDMLAPSWPNLGLFIFVSFTRVQLEFNSHLTGDPRFTEIANDYSPSKNALFVLREWKKP